MDVIEFLEARIREDEEAAMHGYYSSVPYSVFDGGPVTQQSAELPPLVRTRVLGDSAAKRQIIMHCTSGPKDFGSEVLYILARAYKSHPDYRQEWAPPEIFGWETDIRSAA